MNLDLEPLRHRRLEEVQWVLRSAAARGRLRHLLETLLQAGAKLGPCYLRHVRYGPGHSLRAYYDVRVQYGSEEGYSTRPIAVAWGSNRDVDQPQEAIAIAKAQTAAVHHYRAEPFMRLAGDFSESGVRIWVYPLDVRFPQLLRMSDPTHVRQVLQDTYVSGGAESDPNRLGEYTVTPVRYRPGKRHVLRCTPREGRKRTVFAKLYQDDKGSRVFHAAKQVADWFAGRVDGVSCVRPLAYLPVDAVVLYPGVFGAPLTSCFRRSNASLPPSLQRAGLALRALHQLPETVVGALESSDFLAEVRQVLRAASPISALLPQVGAQVNALLESACALHERLPQETPTFTHGDFKCDHLYVEGEQLTLIDFDTCRWADPALDVGKFLADIRFWCVFYKCPGLEQAQESFLSGYARAVPTERLIRAHLYELIEFVKLTARRVRLAEEDWISRTTQFVGQARELADRLQRSFRTPAPLACAHRFPDPSGSSGVRRPDHGPASSKGACS